MSQGSLFGVDGYSVEPIQSKDCYELLLYRHYARRIPSISFAFGLFLDGALEGVVCYGRPPSAPQRYGVCGKDNACLVYELNRLCLQNNRKNEASRLVSASLKMMPRPSVVISYADPQHGHEGYVYQATNFAYYGLTEKRSEWKVKGLEHLHSQTIADKFKGSESPSKAIREHYGDRFYLKDRPQKHRYIYVNGSKREKKRISKLIRYSAQEYPKHGAEKGTGQ